MSFTLSDTTREGHVFTINTWHWRTILALIGATKALPEEKIEEMGGSGTGPIVTVEEARAIARELRAQVLPVIAPDDHIFIDGTITREPDDGKMYYDPAEVNKNYRTNGEVLRKLCDFLEHCGELVIH